MDDLGRIVFDHESWLTDRVVHYARLQGHSRYTSTLREAWRSSVCHLNQPLVDAMQALAETDVPQTEVIEAAVAYGLQQAREHRGRGVDLDMFLSLLTFYRRSYFDLMEEKVTAPADRQRMTIALLSLFDAIELELVREAVAARSDAELARLQEANRKLANEKNKYLTVFESIAEPAILIDRDNAPLHMNAAGHRILLGEDKPGSGYYGTPDPERLRPVLDRVLPCLDDDADKPPRVVLETVLGPRSFAVSCQEMLDVSAKFTGRVLILKDVTDLLAATEAARAAERAKSALLAMFSHEIKTPINSIIALTHLLEDDRITPTQRRNIEQLRASGLVLSELVENILGLSRAEAQALQRLDQDFDLPELIEGAILTVEPAARDKGLQIGFEIAPDVPPDLHGDLQKLRHVLVNLLSNAVKFTARGRVALQVTRVPDADGDVLLRFSVQDTGPGLPPGPTDWLFEPFTQYNHTAVEQALRGTGLGLAICRNFVQFLGGSITAHPAPGGGSVFAFEVPMQPARRPRAAAADAGLAVLVIEDDPVNALVTEGYLQQAGHLPTVVGTLREALWQVQSRRFDVLVSDHRLADGTSTDLARHLRGASDPRLRQMPLIVVTAALPGRDEVLSDAVHAVLEKPLQRAELARAVAQAVRPGAENGADRTASMAQDEARAATVLDERVLDQLLADLGVERCRRIVDSYLDNAPVLAADLWRYIGAGNLQGLAETAHKLVSAANVVGLTSIATGAREVLEACNAGRRAALRNAVAGLRQDVLQSVPMLADQFARASRQARRPS